MKIIPTNKIKPDRNQPRKTFDSETLKGMSETIKKHGIIEPIHIDDKRIIITGERRWRASKLAGLKKIPVIIHKNINAKTRLEMQLIEDIHNEDISIPERDKAWKRLYDEYKKSDQLFTKEKLAEILGVSPHTVYATFDRLDIKDEIPEKVLEKISPDVITETAGLEKGERIKIIKKAAKEELGGRKIREIVSIVRKAPEPIKKAIIEEELHPEVAEEIMKIEKPDIQKEAIKEAVKFAKRGTLTPLGIKERVSRVIKEKLEMPQEPFNVKIFNKVIWNLTRIEKKDFYTIGFGEWEIEQFIKILKKAEIKTLVDVRDTPFSEFKPEFNKNNLQRVLKEKNIKYIHYPKLGVPFEIRQKLAKTQDYEWFFKWYDKNVLTNGVLDSHDFESLSYPIAIMCTEFDPTKCHRSRIALALEDKGLKGFDL